MPKLIEIPKATKSIQFINKTETVTEILIYGEIGESFWSDSSVSAKQFAEELKKLPSSIKEIHLRVNSPGGSVFDGMAIYEKIKSEKSKGRKVVAYVDGVAASMASVIILAADEVIIGDGAFIMIHKPLVGAYGNATELERMISILDKIEDQMIGIYAKKTGMSKLEISNALAAETWYNSDEALEAGIADKKFDAADSIGAAASMIQDCKWMKNKPTIQNKNDLVREKLREFNSKAKDFLNKK